MGKILIRICFQLAFVLVDFNHLGIRYASNHDRPHNFNALYNFKHKKLMVTAQFTF